VTTLPGATRPLEFGFAPPPGDREMGPINRATYVRDLDEQLRFAVRYFSSVWTSDHVMEHPNYRHECWTQLAWIAARHPEPLLGTCVLANSYRNPALMAKMAATLQELSGGRLIFGIGAGWLEEEYRGYGWEFPSTRVRIEQLDEALRLTKLLWTQKPVDFEGRYYRLEQAVCEPRPDPLPPIMVGGDGEKYLLRVVAEHADWWFSYASSADVLARKIAALQDHCHDVGRDIDEIRMATPLTVYLGRTMAEARTMAGDQPPSDRPPFIGDPAAFRDRLTELHGLGFELVEIRFARLFGIEDVQLFVDQVLPAFR
jgi:alkanesulfonate monooxygenase SsuD/methylene tetrahydromethanopterin reductase-like flavin-dependent oxidoreductase (luciferase family)